MSKTLTLTPDSAMSQCKQQRTLRGVMLGLCCMAAVLFVVLIHIDMTYAQTQHTLPSSPHPLTASSSPIQPGPIVAKTDLQQGGIISTIQSIFNYVINATVYFPAKTFQEAVEKAARNIFTGQLDVLRGPLREVIQVYAFANSAVFGNLAIPAEVRTIGTRLTQAAVPIWVLSLVLLGMAALTRSAVGMGYGSTDIAAEGARWFFIALASGNGASIVNWVHTGFGALTYAVASSGGSVSAAEFVTVFIPSIDAAKGWPILVLVIGTVLGLITVIVLAVTYLARYTLLLAVTGLAPLCIACEGIPFTRFVFRDWISIFLRLEFLQIINVTVLVIFKAIGFLAAAHGGGVTQAILLLTVMLGLSSTLIGINVSVFKQVFGTAIDVAAQMKSAGEQMVRVMGQLAGVAAGLASGGATGAVPALASASALGGAAGDQAQASTNASAGQSTQQGLSASAGGVARALGQATGNPFLRGFADGTSAVTDTNRQRAAANRVIDQQQQAQQRRSESLAREMGATASDDVEAITQSISAPPAGRSSEQMQRAHRDNADLLRGMVREYGSPGRAAAVGGYPSFGAMAVALAEERLGQSSSAPASQSRSEANDLQTARTNLSAQDQLLHANSSSVVLGESAPTNNTATTPAHRTTAVTQQNSPITDSGQANVGRAIGSSDNVPAPASMPSGSSRESMPIAASNNDFTEAQSKATTLPTSVPNQAARAASRIPSVATPSDSYRSDQGAQSTGQSVDTASAAQSVENATTTASPSSASEPPTPSNQPNMPSAMPDALSPTETTSRTPATSVQRDALTTPDTTSSPVSPSISNTPPSTLPTPVTHQTPAEATPSSLNDWLAQVPPTPIQGWIQAAPALTDPGSHNMTPYDFGVGATLARSTQSSPTHAPHWAQTAHDLRMAFGEQYINELLSQTQQQPVSERQLMAQIDTHMSDTPAVRSVHRFWLPNMH